LVRGVSENVWVMLIALYRPFPYLQTAMFRASELVKNGG
jgi:hypothetical protein